MGALGVILGLFTLFMLLFNGGIGETIYNYSAAFSAFALIALGIATLAGIKREVVLILCVLAVLLILPIIYMYLTGFSEIVWPSIIYHALCILVALLIAITHKPNKAPQPTPKSGAAEL